MSVPARLLVAATPSLGFHLLLVLVVNSTNAQSGLQVETDFERQVNLYRWQSVAQWQSELAQWKVSLANRFVSDAFIQSDNRLRFRDEDRLRLNAERSLTPRLDTRVRGYIDWFGSSRASSQALYGSVRYKLLEAFTLEPLVGVASDRRPGVPLPDGTLPQRFDAGLAGGGTVQMAPRSVAGYVLALDAEGIWERITPRRGRQVYVSGSAERTFGSARLASAIRLSSQRRDTYQASSFLNRDREQYAESIEATISDTLDARLQVMAPVFTGGLRIMAQADVQANNRRIRTARAPEESIYFETDFSRRAFNGEFGLLYDRGSLSAELTAQVNIATEQRQLSNREMLPTSEASRKTFLLQQADYEEGVLGIQGRLRTVILSGLTLLVNGSSRIVRHDTPAVNLDDRDEVVHNVAVGLEMRASRYLRLEVKTFGSYYHTVFLNGERSAENSVQRSLRIRPAVEWRPIARHGYSWRAKYGRPIRWMILFFRVDNPRTSLHVKCD